MLAIETKLSTQNSQKPTLKYSSRFVPGSVMLVEVV